MQFCFKYFNFFELEPDSLEDGPYTRYTLYGGTLFLTQRGIPFHRSNFNKIIKKYTKKSGLKKRICPHSFRHTCATQMLEKGADIRYIQQLLGHESIQTTQIYTRVTIKDLKRVHRRFHPRERAG